MYYCKIGGDPNGMKETIISGTRKTFVEDRMDAVRAQVRSLNPVTKLGI